MAFTFTFVNNDGSKEVIWMYDEELTGIAKDCHQQGMIETRFDRTTKEHQIRITAKGLKYAAALMQLAGGDE